jgi:hypothetical protein
MTVQFINSDEAMQYLTKIADPITRALTSHVVMQLYRYSLANQPPASDVDLLFVVQAVCKAMSLQDVLRAILSGNIEEWPEPV